MSASNREIADQFERMAAMLQITGANAFKVNANAKVARTIRDQAIQVADLAADTSALTELDGIGASSARKIVEYVQTGSIQELKDLESRVPPGLLQVLELPGLGPKTVQVLWEQASIESIDDLKKAIDDGSLLSLPRMGQKTIDNIRDSIEFAASSAGRIRLGDAMPVAEWIVDELASTGACRTIEIAGSLRRGQETIGDIDILVDTDEPAIVSDRFTSLDGIQKILAAGSTKCSIRLEEGIQVDLRIIPTESFGAGLMYFTGSKEHNVLLRELAISSGLRLNEYGLFPATEEDAPPQELGIEPVASGSEEAIYEALELPLIPPTMRLARGETSLQKIPELVRTSDIKSELHAHTTASDGRLSIKELALEAKSRGYKVIAVTDHSVSSIPGNGLSPERLLKHIEEIRHVDQEVDGIRILVGSEVDILSDGRLDYEDELLEQLDVVVASPHVALRQEPKVATRRLLRAIEHPLVHIIGHPTGRLINSREGLSPDMPALVEAAIEHDTALEINANPHRLDLRDIHVRVASDAGCLVAINTDAHDASHLDYLEYGVMTSQRGWLERSKCINTWTPARLLKWLASKR